MPSERQATLDYLIRIEQKVDWLSKSDRRLKSTIAFYQQQEGVQRDRAERSEEALLALRRKRIVQHQSYLWHDNQDRFASLRRQIYECFRDHIFPKWDPRETPAGMYWKILFEHARTHPWCVNVDGATYRRRLNELSDHRIHNRPLQWLKPGYYLLAALEVEAK